MKPMRYPFLVLACLLAGCASYGGEGLKPGVSNEGQVRSAMGQPAVELANPDGSRTLAYPKGPLGTQTFMVSLRQDGTLESIEQVLDERHIYRITPGLTRDDILRLIGPPAEVHQFPRLQQTAWDYRYQDGWGYTAILSVMFDAQGIVVGRTSHRLDRGERNTSR